MTESPQYIVGIDPGKHTAAVAVFTDGVLTDTVWATAKRGGIAGMAACAVARIPNTAHVIMESQQIYRTISRRNPNDMIAVAQTAGFLVGTLAARECSVEWVLPRVWKGNIKKEIFARRILAQLSDAELALFQSIKLPKSQIHNIVDAIGLGLWGTRRLGKRA